MAQIVFTCSDAVFQRISDAFTFDYQSVLVDGSANPLTRAQYGKREMIRLLKDRVRQVEQHLSNQTIDQSVESDITIT